MKELVKKAKDLGFEPVIVGSLPWKYSNRENLRKMIWLMQLKEFIFSKWNRHISVRHRCDDTFDFLISYTLDNEFYEKDSDLSYKTELESLQAGCEHYINSIIE